MTFFEKVMKAAIDQDITNVNQLANATGIPYNALRSCKEKNKPLSDSHKRLLARALKCSVGDINRMMSEARAEELKEQWPDKAKCSPAKPKEELVVESEPIPEPKSNPVPDAEAVSEPEQEIAPEPPNEDQVLEEKIEDIKAKADVLLTYHDRIKEAAEATLVAEYSAMLRSRMLDVAMADLYDLCGQFIENTNPSKAAAFVDVASEIMKLTQEEK